MARRRAGIYEVRRGGSRDGSREAWKGLIYVASARDLRVCKANCCIYWGLSENLFKCQWAQLM